MSQPVDKHNTQTYEWASGCQAWVLNDSAAASIKEERMEPGTREQLHLHKQTEQFFYILEGEAVIYLEGNAVSLQRYQGLQIPALATHYIANESAAPVRFLVISSPGNSHSVNGQADRENIS